jgi:hypothetical protein
MISDLTTDIFAKHGLLLGRLISYSKRAPVEHQVYWNANVISEHRGKIWYGDISVTKDEGKLQTIANEMGEMLYVLRESACRFEHENDPVELLRPKAVCIIHPTE